MELRQLEVFVAVAEELHFGRAARRMHLSQPALTQAIARLERDLGVRLLERTSRHVALTDAGAALLGRARPVLADVDDAVRLVQRTARGELATVRIGVVGTALLGPVSSLVRAMRATHPGVDLDLREQVGAAQLADLRAGRLDLGLLHADPAQPPAGVELALLARDRLHVALPADHPLAHRTVLRLAELRDDPLIAIRSEPEADTYGRYLEACAAAGFVPRPGPHVGSLGALLGFVAADLGWAFVAEPVARGLRREGVVTVRLRGTAVRLPTALAWPTGVLPPAAAVVRDTLDRIRAAPVMRAD